ncbi:plasmid stabilization system protein [Burkholderia ubonensis]|nr:plasmid stabilization system protein [Burkholderia ubonensis]
MSGAIYRVFFSPEARDQLAALEDLIAMASAPRAAANYVEPL